MYAFIQNGQCVAYPYTVTDYRAAHPNVSVPLTATSAQLQELGIYEVKPVTPPIVTANQTLTDGTPVLVGGAWTQNWVVVDASPAEVAARVDAQWVEVRSQRNAMLTACDWTQLPDVPVDATVWAAYRQALRDITQQSDPFAIVWPQPPEA